MWIGRWTGLVFIAGMLLVQRAPLRIPADWLPFVGLQGGLDTLGYFAFLAGPTGRRRTSPWSSPPPSAWWRSCWQGSIIHEPVSKMQWAAIALIAAGTAV